MKSALEIHSANLTFLYINVCQFSSTKINGYSSNIDVNKPVAGAIEIDISC